MAYTTVTVDEDDHEEFVVETGERLDNVFINCTADGASATITARGTGWEIRHLAVVGHNDTDEPLFNVSDRAGTTAVIDNVWAATGGDGPGIHVDRRHSGELTIARTRIENFAGGGILSHSPQRRGGGTTHYETCYIAGCYTANIQTGTDTLEDVTVDPTDGDYTGRALWARGDTTVTNCNLGGHPAQYTIHAGTPGNAVTVTVEGSEYGDDYGNTQTVGGYGGSYGGPYSGGGVTGGNGMFIESGSEVNTDRDTGTLPTLSVPVGAPLTEEHAADGDEDMVAAPGHGLSVDDFEVIEVGYDSHETISITTGETYKNIRFDLSANRASATIIAEGSDWALENVIFDGVDNRPNSTPAYGIVASVAPGASATIDNVYMGDGSALGPGDFNGRDRGKAAMYIPPHHAGELSVERSTIAEWPGGGITTSPQTTGDLHVTDCYFRDCGWESLTLPTAASTADGCTFINHQQAPESQP